MENQPNPASDTDAVDTRRRAPDPNTDDATTAESPPARPDVATTPESPGNDTHPDTPPRGAPTVDSQP